MPSYHAVPMKGRFLNAYARPAPSWQRMIDACGEGAMFAISHGMLDGERFASAVQLPLEGGTSGFATAGKGFQLQWILEQIGVTSPGDGRTVAFAYFTEIGAFVSPVTDIDDVTFLHLPDHATGHEVMEAAARYESAKPEAIRSFREDFEDGPAIRQVRMDDRQERHYKGLLRHCEVIDSRIPAGIPLLLKSSIEESLSLEIRTFPHHASGRDKGDIGFAWTIDDDGPASFLVQNLAEAAGMPMPRAEGDIDHCGFAVGNHGVFFWRFDGGMSTVFLIRQDATAHEVLDEISGFEEARELKGFQS